MRIFAALSNSMYPMDDFGDYIYLIAIVIAGLSSLLRKKKPAQQQGRAEDMPDLDDVIPDVDQSWNEPYETVYKPEPVSGTGTYTSQESPGGRPFEFTTMKKTEKAPLTYETVADFIKLKAQKTVKPVSNLVKNYEEAVVVVEPEIFIEFENADDVKKAFIYSEIFNRKY
jgi:hypothetical protein